MSVTVRFLHNFDLTTLHKTFLHAFSDYLIPMQLTREQFEQLLTRRGAQNQLSVAAFDKDVPVAFTINAFEEYQGVPTLYDVVTGVVPEFRGKGIAKQLFEFSLPELKRKGAVRYALEVFEKNQPAVRLYSSMGFHTQRKLYVFTTTNRQKPEKSRFTIRAVEPRWDQFQSFWDWQPSWQNSIRCMERIKSGKYVAGVFQKGQLIGYGIIYTGTGDIPQFAIDQKYRRIGAGRALYRHLQSQVQELKPVRVVNLDGNDQGSLAFWERLGFYVIGTQNEMHLAL